MDNERVEAAAKAITNEIGKLRDEGLQWNDDVPAIAAAALTAAEKVQGERVIESNNTDTEHGGCVMFLMGRKEIRLKPGEEIVVRKRRGT